MEKIKHKLQTFIGGNIRRNTMFGEHMKNKQTCQVHGHNGVMSRNKDCLLGELVNYDQDGVKSRR